MKIAVFGLGYVGTVTAACLAGRGHSIVGVDVQPEKTEALRRGEPSVIEPGVADLLGAAKAGGLLAATTDAAQAVRDCEASIVCVGTPSTPAGSLDLRYVHQVATEIAEALRREPKPHALVLRSTMLPGSTQRLVDELGLSGSDRREVEVLYYPEFLREGSGVADFETPSMSVVGTATGDPPNAAVQAALIPPGTTAVPWSSAEMIKYASNAYHATKVVFANEIGRLAKSFGVDGREVMELLCTDTRLNLSSYYLRPGNPFGGSCLPKDVRALVRRSRQLELDLPLLESLLHSNTRHLESLLGLVTETGQREVVILGLSFKAGTDDLRESPMVEVAQTLHGRGYELRIHDPTLNLRALVGSNKRLIETRLPHLASMLHDDLATAIGRSGVILAAQRVGPLEALAGLVTARHHVIDVNGWPELASLAAPYQGLCW
jgi:GDP-mannose 6-dehydrogenase